MRCPRCSSLCLTFSAINLWTKSAGERLEAYFWLYFWGYCNSEADRYSSSSSCVEFSREGYLQRSDQHQFLYETTVEALVKDVTQELTKLHNLRQRILKLKMEGDELAKYGPAKLPDKQGIDTYVEGGVEKGQHYLMDPTGRRTGNGTTCARSSQSLYRMSIAVPIVNIRLLYNWMCLKTDCTAQHATRKWRRCSPRLSTMARRLFIRCVMSYVSSRA